MAATACEGKSAEDARTQPLPVDPLYALAWRIQTSKSTLVVYLNFTGSELSAVAQHPLAKKADDLQQRLNACIHNYREKEPAHSFGEGIVDVSSSPPFETVESLNADVTAYENEVAALRATQPIPSDVAVPERSLQTYNDLFRAMPLPEVAKDFHTDEAFARFRVAGPNPMLIEGLTKAELCALIGDRLSDEDFNTILGTTGDSVQKAGEDGRLCVANYEMLTNTVPFAQTGVPFVQDPIAVFAEPVSGSDFIKPVCIQLGQDPAASEVVMANTPDVYRWQIAKTVVQAADGVMFLLVAHVAQTHQVIGRMLPATSESFSQNHPVLKLLAPHFEGTEAINRVNLDILLDAARGPADDPIQVAEGEDPSAVPLVLRATRSFLFTERSPDRELKARKVGKLKVYPYRDDALLVWDAIKNWVKDYVDLYYDNDQAVASDVELAAWSKAIIANPNLNGFVSPQSKESLVHILAVIVYIATAQHTAVHYVNQDYVLYAPAAPNGVWGPIPPVDAGPATETDWINILPSIPAASVQLDNSFRVGDVRFSSLGEYETSRFPYYGTLDKKTAPALKKFKQELDSIEKEITKRNKERGSFAYRFMLPSLIQASIHI